MPRSGALGSISPPSPLPPPTRAPRSSPPAGPPLWRFLLVSAVLVAVAGSVLVAHLHARTDIRVTGKVTGTPTPTAERAGAAARATPDDFLGSGTWVMSSLPECFTERKRTRGGVRAVRRAVPPARWRIAAGTRLQRSDCTVVVGADDVRIFRGADRLRVPPEAQLYRTPDGLTLVTQTGGFLEIREY